MGTHRIEAGRLRSRFSLQKYVQSDEPLGDAGKNWTHISFIFGYMILEKADYSFSADQNNQMITHRIVFRYRNDIEVNMRLIKNNCFFRILAVWDPDQSQRYLMCLTCEEKA